MGPCLLRALPGTSLPDEVGLHRHPRSSVENHTLVLACILSVESRKFPAAAGFPQVWTANRGLSIATRLTGLPIAEGCEPEYSVAGGEERPADAPPLVPTAQCSNNRGWWEDMSGQL